MNYTENYHLPQWEEGDRILRKDFNQMCADLEKGLNSSEDKLDQAVAELREGISESQTADQVFDRRFFRLMYNHYSMLRSMDPFPRQVGVFYQDPALDGSAATPGVTQRENAVYMSNTDKAEITPTEFLSTIIETQSMELVEGDLDACTPEIATFVAPAAGEMEKTIATLYYTKSSETKILYAVLELKNLDTGTATIRKTLRIELPAGTTSTAQILSFKLHFCNGPYQITITPMNAPVDGRLVCNFASSYARASFFAAAAGASFHQTYCCLEDYEEAMVILRFKGGGIGGKMTFTWNGEAVEPAMIREVPLDDGRIVQENIYYRKGDVPKNNEFDLSFQCEKGSDFWFYDWGGIFC